MRSPRCARLLLLLLLLPLLLTPPAGDAAIITGACENDPQCGGGMCCAVSIWVKSIRICTPLGKVGDSCHPMSHKVSIYVFLAILEMEGRKEERGREERKRIGSIQSIQPGNKVPYMGERKHHTCPCLPDLACSRNSSKRYTCSARK
ncbi:PROK2 [Cervus elaphus hippelaphus]|uniref:PROK2 n=1 Tax=Cervus elaphus hippelaphus TaxID=46360 RepID=A0A212C920_CEREH|nr:PROK2 [Cervus elaphus hippelaphus]